MERGTKPRFSSTGAALRFYFRAREFLGSSSFDAPRMGCQKLIATAVCTGAIGDFLSVASCVRDLDEFELWLMGELFGPTCFSARERTVARAWEEARRQFPDRSVTIHSIARVRRTTLDVLRRRLEAKGLVAPSVAARSGDLARSARTCAVRSRDGSNYRH